MSNTTSGAGGLVLVWDMDSTIVGNYFNVRSNQELIFNERAVAVLKLAVEARKTGKVAAIFLLTNNSDAEFIKLMRTRLALKIGVPRVFDYAMQRYHPARPFSEDPPKRLQDVAFMMNAIKMPTANLQNRVFFFDDRGDHEIRAEIPSSHYIQISPPYKPNIKDSTNFKPVANAIRAFGGGARKTRRHRRSKRAHTYRMFRRY